MIGYFYIFLTIAFTTYGQFILKWRMNQLNIILPDTLTGKALFLLKLVIDPFVLSAFISAFLASLAWMMAMTKFELSFAYPFMALNFALIFILGVWAFDESVTSAKLIGMCFILVGTAVIARGG